MLCELTWHDIKFWPRFLAYEAENWHECPNPYAKLHKVTGELLPDKSKEPFRYRFTPRGDPGYYAPKRKPVQRCDLSIFHDPTGDELEPFEIFRYIDVAGNLTRCHMMQAFNRSWGDLGMDKELRMPTKTGPVAPPFNAIWDRERTLAQEAETICNAATERAAELAWLPVAYERTIHPWKGDMNEFTR